MNRWIKSLQRINKTERIKYARITIEVNKIGQYLVKTRKGMTVMGSPHATREDALAWLMQANLMDRLYEPK